MSPAGIMFVLLSYPRMFTADRGLPVSHPLSSLRGVPSCRGKMDALVEKEWKHIQLTLEGRTFVTSADNVLASIPAMPTPREKVGIKQQIPTFVDTVPMQKSVNKTLADAQSGMPGGDNVKFVVKESTIKESKAYPVLVVSGMEGMSVTQFIIVFLPSIQYFKAIKDVILTNDLSTNERYIACIRVTPAEATTDLWYDMVWNFTKTTDEKPQQIHNTITWSDGDDFSCLFLGKGDDIEAIFGIGTAHRNVARGCLIRMATLAITSHTRKRPCPSISQDEESKRIRKTEEDSKDALS